MTESSAENQGKGTGGGLPRRLSRGSRIAVNALSNWVAMSAQVLVNTFLVAYVLRYLSKEEFGVYGFAASMMMMVGVLSLGVAPSLLRICATSLATGDWDRLSNALSVARTLTWGVAAVALAGIVCLGWFGLDLFNIPEANQATASRLMALMGVVVAALLLEIPYRAALLARQRYELPNAVRVGSLLLRLGVVVWAFESGWVRLEVIGGAHAGAELLACAALVGLRRRVLPEADLSVRRLDRQALRDVVSHTLWTGLSAFTRSLRDQGAVPLVSAVPRFGVVGAGILYLPKMASAYLIRMVSGVTQTVWPVAAQLAATGQRERLLRLYRVVSPLTVGFQVVALAAVVTHGRALLRFLKPEAEAWFPLFLVYMGLTVARTATIAGEHMVLGCGRLPHIGLSRLVAVATGFGAAAAVGWGTEAPLWAIVVALFAPGVVRALVYIPWRVRVDLGVPYTTIYGRGLAGPVAMGTVALAVGWALRAVWPAESLVAILVPPVVAAVAYGVGWWFGLLDGEDRALFRRTFGRSGRRKGGGPAAGAEAKEPPAAAEPAPVSSAEQGTGAEETEPLP